MLRGKSVTLRRIEKVDLWQLWQRHEERELILFKELKQLISWDELNRDFMEYFGWKGNFLVEDKGGRTLGVCSYKDINWKNRSCELAVQFYKTEEAPSIDTILTLLEFLFKELNMSRVYSFVPVFFSFENQALKRTGFIPEGNLREAIFCEGKYHDILAYSFLREDFSPEEQ
jgi:RimJ/RimL family protein N-acetyltransferase